MARHASSAVTTPFDTPYPDILWMVSVRTRMDILALGRHLLRLCGGLKYTCPQAPLGLAFNRGDFLQISDPDYFQIQNRRKKFAELPAGTRFTAVPIDQALSTISTWLSAN
jgi:hypothetical protein